MDRELSRRRLLQVSAVGALGATAGCVSHLPNSLQCRIDGPTTFTFTPASSIEEMVKDEIEADDADDSDGEPPTEDEDEIDLDARVEYERDRLVEILAVRTRIGIELDLFPQAESAELRDEATISFQFADHTADADDVEYVVGSNGSLEVTVTGNETPETTALNASGEARRSQTTVQQLQDGTWVAQLPLGPQEREEFQRTLREDIEDEDEYTFTTSLHGKTISETQVNSEAVDEITSDDWEHSLTFSGLQKRDAAAVLAHARPEGLPVDVEMSTSCRDLEFKLDGLPGEEPAPDGPEDGDDNDAG